GGEAPRCSRGGGGGGGGGGAPRGPPRRQQMSAPLLETRGLSKHFGGVHAVAGLDLAMAEGEVLGLIGPNGAGKTTVFNLLSGFLRPDAGAIRFPGGSLLAQ